MSKQKVSSMVRGASMAAEVWARLDKAVKDKGGVDKDLHLLAREGGQAMIDQIADMLVRAGAATRNAYLVTVDYTQSLARMIAEGKYGYVSKYVVATNFPMSGTGIFATDVVVVHFDRNIESYKAIKELEQMSIQPAPIEYLLALGAKYPDLQREYPIVALGSVCSSSDGDQYVPVLDRWYAERRLLLLDRSDVWVPNYRFLAFHK